MPRIAGVDLPNEKKVKFALTYLYGIGRQNVNRVIEAAKVDPDKRAKDLTDLEIAALLKAIEQFPTEGVLRKMVAENIKRLKQNGSYRGLRHNQRLPVRGQRTRSNARTKRGKRVTIGALRKEMAQKMEVAKKE
jgi:small subunit ribosomal protein S13